MSVPDSDLGRLSAAARRGTSRTGLPEVTPTQLGEALSRVRRDTPEAALLARAALSGLYLQAGRAPGLPSVPAPQFVPVEPPAPAIPAALDRLLPALHQHPAVLREALTLLLPSGRRLNAVQARPLLMLGDQGGEGLRDCLWPLLNEHARWLARLHPVWKRHDPESPSAAVYLARLRRELVEAHAAHPEQAAADITARWPTFRADERRAALNAAASSLGRADWPLLQLAMNDKLPDVRRQARLLQGHLPGEVQDAVRAALTAALSTDKRGKLKVLASELTLPRVLDETSLPYERGDSALRRLLGALPLPLLLELLSPSKRTFTEASEAVLDWYSSSPGEGYGDLVQAAAESDLDTLMPFSVRSVNVTTFWPQARVQAMLWQATARLLEQSELDGALLRLTAQLFGALEGPLPSTPDGPTAEPKKGLLARVASALGARKTGQHDWPARMHALAERLLLSLGREASTYQQPVEALLGAVPIHLDPARPDPSGPAPVPPPELPVGATRKQQDAQTLAQTLYSQQLRARAHMTQTLALRRQVRVALGGGA